MDALEDASVAEDTAYTVQVSASDVDGDDLTYSASVDNGLASVDGSTLTVTPAQDYNGDLTVTVTASDGYLTSSSTFTLEVTPVNDLPVVDAIAAQTVAEDTAFTFELSATDADGDAVSFDVYVDSGSASVDGSTLTVVPATDFNGDLTVTVYGSDADGTGGGTSFILTVTPVNDAPVVDALEDTSVAEDTAYTCLVYPSPRARD